MRRATRGPVEWAEIRAPDSGRRGLRPQLLKVVNRRATVSTMAARAGAM